MAYPSELSFLYIGKMDFSKHTKKSRKHNAHDVSQKNYLVISWHLRDKFKGKKRNKEAYRTFSEPQIHITQTSKNCWTVTEENVNVPEEIVNKYKEYYKSQEERM